MQLADLQKRLGNMIEPSEQLDQTIATIEAWGMGDEGLRRLASTMLRDCIALCQLKGWELEQVAAGLCVEYPIHG